MLRYNLKWNWNDASCNPFQFFYFLLLQLLKALITLHKDKIIGEKIGRFFLMRYPHDLKVFDFNFFSAKSEGTKMFLSFKVEPSIPQIPPEMLPPLHPQKDFTKDRAWQQRKWRRANRKKPDKIGVWFKKLSSSKRYRQTIYWFVFNIANRMTLLRKKVGGNEKKYSKLSN